MKLIQKKSYFKTKIALVTIVVLVIVTFGYLFYRHTEKAGVEEKTQAHEEHKTKIIYYDMSPIVVNLDTNTEESKFLKISISLVLKDNQGLEVVKELEPSIRDTYFVYLRQLRSSDVRGPIAIYRLREALLKRTNKAVYPSNVEDLLFHEILVQ